MGPAGYILLCLMHYDLRFLGEIPDVTVQPAFGGASYGTGAGDGLVIARRGGRGEQRFLIFSANRACGIINICILREKSRSIMILSEYSRPIGEQEHTHVSGSNTPSKTKYKEGA